MNQKLSLNLNRSRAFTLLEMLVVVAIIVIMLAFSTPALMRTMQTSRLSSTGESIFGAISEAQQIAFAQNVPVELRFFKFNDEFQTNPGFRSYQMFKVNIVTSGTGASTQVKEEIVPVGGLISIPEGIVVVSDEELSPVLSGDGLPDTKGTDGAAVGYSGVPDATYNALRFMTDGSCRKVGKSANNFATLTYETLPKSFLTITFDGGQPVTLKNLPADFYTIQVDPFTGKARNYRPGF